MQSALSLALLCALLLSAAARELPHNAPPNDDWTPPTVYTILQVGTPAVSFKMLVDLVFEDAIIAGPKCTAYACKGQAKNRTIYDPAKSSTSKDQGDPAQVNYGQTVTGEYYTDVVTVDGISDTDVGFAVLNTASPKFYKVPYDGVFGLSFLGHTRGKKQLPSPVQSILKGSDQQTLQLWFNQATSNDDRYGTLTFGKANTDKCNGDTKWSSVTTLDFTFEIEKIRYGTFVAHRQLPAQIQVGSKTIGLPTTIYKDLMRVATGSTSGTSVDCDSVKQMTLDIKIGGQYFPLKGEDFSYAADQWNCYLLVTDIGDEFDLPFILGEPFLRRYCTTYDLAQQSIGFSTVKN